MHRYALAVIILLLSASSAWGDNTLTWKDNSSDEAYFVIERRTLNGQYHNRVYDYVGPNTEMYIDDRVDDKDYCYRVSAVNFDGIRSSIEFCMGIIPAVGNVIGVGCALK